MRLLEQFRVKSPDGQQHTVACYEDSLARANLGQRSESVNSVRYCLNGTETIARITDDTFMTSTGVLLKREG